MTAKPARSQEERKRQNVRKLIFGECRRQGIDEDTRHAIQVRVTGKASLTEMSLHEMAKVMHAVRRGYSADRRRAAKPRGARAHDRKGEKLRADLLPAGPHTSKLRALWISAFELGVVRDREDKALAAWICRQTGMDAARWATPRQTSACIEALKDWMARDPGSGGGGVDWRPYARDGKRPVHVPGARILEALWRRLHEAGAVRIADHGALQSWVVGFRRAQDSYSTLNASTLNQLIRELGKWLRKEMAGGGGE